MALPERLTGYEESIVADRDVLIAKHRIMEKMHQLLHLLQLDFENYIMKSSAEEKIPVDLRSGKISKGERYRDLPYLISDYPRHFSREKIMAVRSMFWWGNHFSFTLHLQGAYRDQYIDNIRREIHSLDPQHYYIGHNASPWEYHFGEDNYTLLELAGQKKVDRILEEHPFVKISRKERIGASYETVRQTGIRAFSEFIRLLGLTGSGADGSF